jgi:hypothetical protein
LNNVFDPKPVQFMTISSGRDIMSRGVSNLRITIFPPKRMKSATSLSK